jgi:hypothetical protein
MMEPVIGSILSGKECFINFIYGKQIDKYEFRPDGTVIITSQKRPTKKIHGIYTKLVNTTINEYEHLNEEGVYDVVLYVFTDTTLCRIRLTPRAQEFKRNTHTLKNFLNRQTRIFANRSRVIIASPSAGIGGQYFVSTVHIEDDLDTIVHTAIHESTPIVKFFQDEYGEIYCGMYIPGLNGGMWAIRSLINLGDKEIISPKGVIHFNGKYVLVRDPKNVFELMTRSLKVIARFVNVRDILFTIFGMLVIDLAGNVDLYDISSPENVNPIGRLVHTVGEIYHASYNRIFAHIPTLNEVRTL